MFNRLYIHVPFCVKKCLYCAFVSDAPQKDDLAKYPELLIREARLIGSGSGPVDSIYFGGGTPSLLQPEQLAPLIEEIARTAGISPDAEITMEANPGTIDRFSLERYRAAGINRLSLGIQSFDDRFLECLGRIHTAGQSRRAFRDAREAGFDNISIDLIHALPGQSLEQWRAELLNAVSLRPEHISIYGLTVEEDTPFARIYPVDSPALADEDLSADMFELADRLLPESGFDHYEIANYARPGFRSRHNSGYWKRDGYRGLGVAAHSFLRDGYGVRFSNPGNLEDYRREVANGRLLRIDAHSLTEGEAMAEYMFLGLRLAEGVSLAAFEREFGRSPAAVYGAATADLVRLGLLMQNGDALALTRRGMMLSNQVFARFV